MATAMFVITCVSLAITLIGITAKVTIGVSAFNSLKDIVDIDKIGQLKGFDEAYLGMAGQALEMLGHFLSYAQLLVGCCAFLALIFNAFKLWASAIELKKFFVDAIFKCLIVMALMMVYPQVIYKTIDIGTELGVEASGGYDSVNTAFSELAVKVQTIWDKGTEELINVLSNGGTRDSEGNLIISDTILNEFTKTGLSKEEATQYLAKKGIVVGDSGASGMWFWKNDQSKLEKKAKDIFNSDAQMIKFMKQSLSIVDSLAEVLTGKTSSDITDGTADGSLSRVDIMTEGKDALEKMFLNPYIDNTKRLSVGTMLKTAIIVQEIASSGALSSAETNEDGTGVSLNQIAESDSPRLVVKLIGTFLKFFLYKIVLVLSIMIVMIEYILTIIEFLIVASVSALLIPLYFIDATKNFAANILKMILTFFVKIIVSTMMTFFVMGLYIRMGTRMPSLDLNSTTAILYYIFNCLIGVILAKSSGKLASAVISGNPSLGIGDVANEMRGVSHMAHSMGHAAGSAMHDIHMAGQKAQGSAHAWGDKYASDVAKGNVKAGAGQKAGAFADHLEQANHDLGMGMSAKDIEKEASKVYKDAVKAGNREIDKDFMFKKMTGQDRGMYTGKGNIVGQSYFDEQGIAKTVSGKTLDDNRVVIAGSNGVNEPFIDGEGNLKKTNGYLISLAERFPPAKMEKDRKSQIPQPEDESLRDWRRR